MHPLRKKQFKHLGAATQQMGEWAADEYPAEWLAEVTFSVDSHENVVNNYEGSYFYRLR